MSLLIAALKNMSAGKKSASPAGRLVREEPRSSLTHPKDASSESKILSMKESKKPKVTKELLERWTSSINSLFAVSHFCSLNFRYFLI